MSLFFFSYFSPGWKFRQLTAYTWNNVRGSIALTLESVWRHKVCDDCSIGSCYSLVFILACIVHPIPIKHRNAGFVQFKTHSEPRAYDKTFWLHSKVNKVWIVYENWMQKLIKKERERERERRSPPAASWLGKLNTSRWKDDLKCNRKIKYQGSVCLHYFEYLW